ncbi:hypothetical protein JD844_033534 [Phrynosoma platyrhinos]|uniref:Ankyrin repeat domain-containing protein 42 n=1 Tax=Phrynosoma platyrhinos TaxID=52577 RepID=A0ABQ7T661_PHRPL|nr:hypothetical protein JD844_033534 [Phrynosoma platyrhinos]
MPAAVTPNATNKKKLVCKTIHEAVKTGNVKKLAEMVKCGISLNELDPVHKFTPLHWAAHSGSLEALHLNGVNVGVQDDRGCTPAHLAANHGQSYTLQTILRSGVDANVSDKNDWKPVHNAAFHGRLGCLQLLVRWGATLDDVDNNGNLPVEHARSLEYAVATTTAAEYVYVDLTFPGHEAAFRGDLDTLRTLLENRIININERDDKGSTLLHKAAGQGHLHVLEWLINREADCDIANDAGETPKDIAKRFAQLAVVEYLKNKMGNDSDEEIDVKDPQFFERHSVEGSTDCKSDLIVEKQTKVDSRERAFQKIEELRRLLEIAISNYKQLGGITPEERQAKIEEKQLIKLLGELELQLENERLRREKLEAQVDEYREEIKTLREQLEETQLATTTIPLTSNSGKAASDSGKVTSDIGKEKKKQKKSLFSPGGVFVRRC